MFASTKVLFFFKKSAFLAYFRICAKFARFLTFHNLLILNYLQKSYKNHLKKNKKNDTPY